MASIVRDKDGRKRILFVSPSGIRKAIRLGKASMDVANKVKIKVESLLSSILTKHALDGETAAWVASLDTAMSDKLAAVGLIPERKESAQREITLADFIGQYIESKQIKKPNTLKNYRATQNSLINFFGAERKLRTISAGDCDEWRAAQVGAGFAPATIGRNVKRARQFFRAAVRKKLIAENVMQEVKASPQTNDARKVFVTQETINRVIQHCPDAEWRLIVALARYGGLRTPSETFALRWGDVDWERNRLTIRASKTAHHSGGGVRVIPLFPELRPYLEAVFDEAPAGSEFVITRHRIGSANLRTTLERIIQRAGEKPWERLFQNLRASRETELARQHPLHVVTAWIGNSAIIASKHYLMVEDADFDKALESGAESGALAAQNRAQQPPVIIRSNSQEKTKALTGEGLTRNLTNLYDSVQSFILPPRGVEPLFSD